MNLRSSRGLLPVACAAALALVALRSGGAQQLTFRSAVGRVAVYATVSDREGRLVPDLAKDQFRVLDNGRPVDITVFSNDAQPITIAVMLNMSGSMGVRMMRDRESTGRFIDTRITATSRWLPSPPLVTRNVLFFEGPTTQNFSPSVFVDVDAVLDGRSPRWRRTPRRWTRPISRA